MKQFPDLPSTEVLLVYNSKKGKFAWTEKLEKIDLFLDQLHTGDVSWNRLPSESLPQIVLV